MTTTNYTLWKRAEMNAHATTDKDGNNIAKRIKVDMTSAKQARVSEIGQTYINAIFRSKDFDADLNELNDRLAKVIAEYNAPAEVIEKLSCIDFHLLMKEKCSREVQPLTDEGKDLRNRLATLKDGIDLGYLFRSNVEDFEGWIIEGTWLGGVTWSNDADKIKLDEDGIENATSAYKTMNDRFDNDKTHGLREEVKVKARTFNSIRAEFERQCVYFYDDIIHREEVDNSVHMSKRLEKAGNGNYSITVSDKGKVKIERVDEEGKTVNALNSDFRRKIQHLYTICSEYEVSAEKRKECVEYIINTCYVKENDVSMAEDFIKSFHDELKKAA